MEAYLRNHAPAHCIFENVAMLNAVTVTQPHGNCTDDAIDPTTGDHDAAAPAAPSISNLDEVLARIKRLGYGVAWRLLSPHLVGLPESRRRIYIICSTSLSSDFLQQARLGGAVSVDPPPPQAWLVHQHHPQSHRAPTPVCCPSLPSSGQCWQVGRKTQPMQLLGFIRQSTLDSRL